MLLAALPDRDDLLSTIFRPLGWAFAAWGSTLYIWAGVLYLVQVRQLTRSDRPAEPAEGAVGSS